MFEPNKKLDDEEEGKPGLAILIGSAKKKPAFNPSAKLDEGEESYSGDAEGRFTEACEIMAKMINAGRVDADKLGQCLREAFEALEAAPHEEGEHTNEEN